MLKFLLLIGTFCLINNTWARSLEEIKKSRVLYILTRNAPTTYFIDRDAQAAGMDFELGVELAKKIGVVPKFIVKDSVGDIITSLRGGEGDVAIAGLTKTEGRSNEFIFSRSYQDIKQQLVCNKKFILRDLSKRKNLKRLEKVEILVTRGSSYVQTLENLKKSGLKINYATSATLNTEDILGRVWESKVDCTLADSNIVSIFLRTYPELKIHKSFDEEGLVMIFPKDHRELKEESDKLVENLKKVGALEKIEHRYYGHISNFDYYDYKVFKKRIKTRLKKYKRLFQKAGKKYGVDWRLLASVSYQESHWNPKAKSPTGVRGMMMLTRATAKQMKVRNRLNPAESIFGGAHYLSLLIKRVPPYISKSDRVWMALAAYNVGYYHMRDARSIAIWKELNPNYWKDVKRSLPYLSKKSYFKKLPYGYARGNEPVIYVERIRRYYDLLKKQYP
ncbi:membrane-bound lytic murein transglycosylase MltF [Bacteriovorax sp. DB6_IX]|uniref:membrane-bound lytic murein transglycosylase MltF n=1 Tax=Bacteriovorax sp. DB6_IX TaxID=1353530 RepID=UPI00038A461A|nr:membrane-bound lytic murein transglycosylase MltF [Bacteriovorax sp. DB6_IX]EQC45098.1 transglycosylase SLT domain protein [Bacteriovorax sp. DB6_IX]